MLDFGLKNWQLYSILKNRQAENNTTFTRNDISCTFMNTQSGGFDWKRKIKICS